MSEAKTQKLIEQYRTEAEAEKAKGNFEFAFLLYDKATALEELAKGDSFALTV